MKPGKLLVGLVAVAIVVSAVLLGRQADAPKAEPLADSMADAARKLLDGLRPAQRQKATFAFDDPARLQWHYYPVTPWPRKGAVLVDLFRQGARLGPKIVDRRRRRRAGEQRGQHDAYRKDQEGRSRESSPASAVGLRRLAYETR